MYLRQLLEFIIYLLAFALDFCRHFPVKLHGKKIFRIRIYHTNILIFFKFSSEIKAQKLYEQTNKQKNSLSHIILHFIILQSCIVYLFGSTR